MALFHLLQWSSYLYLTVIDLAIITQALAVTTCGMARTHGPKNLEERSKEYKNGFTVFLNYSKGNAL